MKNSSKILQYFERFSNEKIEKEHCVCVNCCKLNNYPSIYQLFVQMKIRIFGGPNMFVTGGVQSNNGTSMHTLNKQNSTSTFE